MKKKRTTAGKHWHLYLDNDLADKIDLLLHDPLTGRVRYGARGQLIDKLLRAHLRSQTTPNLPSNSSQLKDLHHDRKCVAYITKDPLSTHCDLLDKENLTCTISAEYPGELPVRCPDLSPALTIPPSLRRNEKTD